MVSTPQLVSLINALRMLHVELSWEELADVCWLADRLAGRTSLPTSVTAPPAATPAEPAPGPRKPSPEPTVPESVKDPTADVRVPGAGTVVEDDPHAEEPAARVFPTPRRDASSDLEAGGVPLRAPGAPALPHPLELARAFRPLTRRAPSRTQWVLDEEATVERIAEERTWITVSRPARERWLEVALVVDAAVSMSVWRPTLDELRLLLERQGAFRDVRVWRMDTHVPAPTALILSAGQGRAPHPPDELNDPAGRRLILVASDCVAVGWRDGRVKRVLEAWARRGPVAVVQMLPRTLWRQTGLAGSSVVQVSSSRPGLPSALLNIVDHWQLFGSDDEDGDETSAGPVPIPAFTLEPEMVRGWADVTARTGSDVSATALLLEPWEPKRRPQSSAAAGPDDEQKAQDRLNRFRSIASPLAWQLAGLLAAAPLRLPIMRVVQRALLPRSGQTHLAEVVLGGLFRTANPTADPDELEFEFLPYVQDLLLDSILFSDAIAVFNEASRYLAGHMGQSLDFQAIVSDPTGQGVLRLTQESRPFAEISAKLLRRLGGQYLEVADHVQGRVVIRPAATAAPGPTTTAEIQESKVPPEPGRSPSVRTVYAMGVGIDRYTPPMSPLRGCRNDIREFIAYLHDEVDTQGGVELAVLTLLDDEATRDAVIAGFREHLGRATAGDVALFYYAGHGSQGQSPPEFWHLEPDRLDETLVCFDSREPGCWDLADKELASLIDEVAATGAHVVVVLDTSYSGSGTRPSSWASRPESAIRRVSTDLRTRPIETFIVRVDEATELGRSSPAASFSLGHGGRHILLAACRDDEEAFEYTGAGSPRGAFSYFLVDTLRAAIGPLTYRELFARVSALVSSHVRNQTPQLEASRNDDIDSVFLAGVIRATRPTFLANFRDAHWMIDAGQVNGIPLPVGAEVARLALFRYDASADELRESVKSLATAKVQDVLAASSRIEIEGDAQLDTSQTYKAVIISLPSPALGISLEGDVAACDLIRRKVETTSSEGGPSLFIRVVGDAETPEFRLIARGGQFLVAQSNELLPVPPVDGLDEAGATLAVHRLEHLARWTQTVRLSNVASSIEPGDVKLTILVDGKDVSGRDVRLEYVSNADKPVPPTFLVSMTNNSRRTLYCGLLDLTQRFRVDAGLLNAGCVKLEPGETAWANNGKPIPATVPEEVWNQGVIEYRDVLKLIVCTDAFDAGMLELPSLEMPRAPSRRVSTRGMGIGRNGSLNRLMQWIQTRELGERHAEVIDDWWATEVTITTVRPLASVRLPKSGVSRTLIGDVKLHGHPKISAQARLTSASVASRDLNNLVLPRLLRDDSSVCQRFSLIHTTWPDLSVLELTDVNDPNLVTSETPLLLEVPVGLRRNEHILPVAYDGEFFLPLGRVASRSETATVIALDRLPPPLADGRSLSGAIKIFFQKVISQAAGEDLAYPILGAVDIDSSGSLATLRDTGQVRDRVIQARRILLFVHGIIGTTQSMVPSLQLARLADGRPLAGLYDLVLTFDYESLNTPIEKNARAIKERLEAVSLGAGHGKTLDIVAHSTGGLVSRRFIEREGGNRIASRLVMLGTPNGGAPWPRVSDLATLALALGLNQLAAIAWPTTVLGGLTVLIERSYDLALHELVPGSEVLESLKTGADPGIPYVMLAGNSSIIPAATASADSGRGSLLTRLAARLDRPNSPHTVAIPFFLDEANDIAVSVASMLSLPSSRTPAFEVHPVACDHLSYFRHEAGLRALVEALSPSS